jgi:hypothetical protein
LPNGISIALMYCSKVLFTGPGWRGLIDFISRFWLKGEKQMKTHETDLEKRSFWQLVFLHSKVNGAAYDGEQLPRRNWNWPKDTYFQQRVRRAKWYQPPDKGRLN